MQIDALEQAETLDAMIGAAEGAGREVARRLMEADLARRAAVPTPWGQCVECGARLQSKGLVPRKIKSSVGVLGWQRRVGRCPRGCRVGVVAPMDQKLGLVASQRTSGELGSRACLLAVFVPFATASKILLRAVGVTLSTSAIWSWVGIAGKRAQTALMAEIDAMKAGGMPEQEIMDAKVRELKLVVGADGVMVPFRPNGGSPKGGLIWREIKIGILARIGQRRDRHARQVPHVAARRLVAVLGTIDDLVVRLRLEALRQRALDAPQLTWISDGARGLWRAFDEVFAGKATGILDFYHAAAHLWEAADAWFGYRPNALIWFAAARPTLRHGGVDGIIDDLAREAARPICGPKRCAVLSRVHDYFERHREHLRFPDFKEAGLPLGSGFVESACKWLIQQRFKGVGIRWSRDGFNHLLLLRLAWTNDRFDALFQPSYAPSPNL
ncbi:MAG: ISKra4 family transposase [Ardenticatenales bacterium]